MSFPRFCQATVLALASTSVSALQIGVAKLDNGAEVLVLQDCRDSKDYTCEPFEKRFFEGDGARLERVLSQRGFQEVLLISGGGNLGEGLKVGEVLRRYGAATRVPRGSACVSSCTVAFLGGVIRTVDPEATYEVHAYSGSRNELQDADRARLVGYPDRELEQMALKERTTARYWAAQLFSYVQRMIGGAPDFQQIGAALTSSDEQKSSYIESGQLAKDERLIRLEGAAAAHTALMNIERSSMEDAIALLRAKLPLLGSRAAPALNILNTMFSSAIIRTAPLTQETLLRMGYITPVINR
jgi:hypothetical protein